MTVAADDIDLTKPHTHGGVTLYIYDAALRGCRKVDTQEQAPAYSEPQPSWPFSPEEEETTTIDIPEHWTFKNASVAAGFDGHVREQLPWYDLVSDAIVQIAGHYLGEGGHVIDVGASNGNIARRLDRLLQDRGATITSVEPSADMAARFAGPGELLEATIQEAMPQISTADVIVCNLVLMFLRADEQASVLQDLHTKINAGGALLVIERMIPPSGYLSIVHSRLTLAAKLRAGVQPEEILAKELSLAGSQRPVDARLLLAHGASEWFRYGDFAGWVITKELPHR